MKSLRTLAFLIASLAGSTTAVAQTTIWSAQDSILRSPAQIEGDRPLGWQFPAIVTGNFALSTSQDVVGQTSGTSETYGLNFRSSLNHFRKYDEWRSDFVIRETTSRTPNIGRFVKSDDELKLSSIYLYYLPNHPNVGPYVRAEAAAPIFKGEDAQGEPKVYRIDGTNETHKSETFRLTDGFKPLTTREASGFFYRPFESATLKVETRLGFAAQQIQANGQFARKGGTNPAGEIVVQRLTDISQAGIEAGASVKGTIDEKSGYEVGIDSLTPFVSDRKAGDERSAWRLTNVDAFVKFTSKITEWAAFGYDYKLKLQPQLIDRAQQIHMITLNLTYPIKAGKL